MEWKRKTALTILMVLVAAAFLCSVKASVTVPTTTHFGCGSGAYICFDESKTFTAINKTFQTNGWYFDSYGFEATNCNITVTDIYTISQYKVYMTLSSSADVVDNVIAGTYTP